MGSVPQDRYADINGLRLHWLDWGRQQRQPLLLLHGIGRCAHNFDHLAPHFLDRHDVMAVDLRGHGDSAWHAGGDYTVEDYVGDVDALIGELKLSGLVLWGNSTGGRVAQVLAGMHPERVSAVIVEDVGPERPQEVSDRRASRMSAEESGWADAEELLAVTRKRYPLTSEAILRNFVQHGAKRRDDGRMVWKCDRAITRGFVPTELWRFVEKIRAPILYLLGGASDIVPPRTQLRLQQTLPQAHIVSMPGLGHYPSDEDAAGFLAIADAFLRQSGRRR